MVICLKILLTCYSYNSNIKAKPELRIQAPILRKKHIILNPKPKPKPKPTQGHPIISYMTVRNPWEFGVHEGMEQELPCAMVRCSGPASYNQIHSKLYGKLN